MAHIVPFRAVRPAQDKVSYVTSRAYDSYSPEDLEAVFRFNPYSFLHIIHQSTFHKDKPLADRFAFIKKKYAFFKSQNTLLQDENPCFYLYELRQKNYTFVGLIAGASMRDYAENRIKKHEETLSYRENLFKEYLKVVGFNAEPVLLTYPDQAGLNRLFKTVMAEPPEYHFTSTPDEDLHKLWKIDQPERILQIASAFAAVESLYIADGHHRMASSFLLANELKNENPSHTGKELYNACLSFIIPESQLKIFEFNRMVKDLNGLTTVDFLERLSQDFRVEKQTNGIYKADAKGCFSMYLDGHFYKLSTKVNSAEMGNPLSQLDAQILYEKVLYPLLGIVDLRNNRRLAYSYGKESLQEIKKQIDNGAFAVGFGLYPVSIGELKAIADANLSMPPKSTYIIPKLRTGLTVYEF
ncbi:MAG: DUF1015 domain-containing protein [Flavobacteriaceae bacterium]|nr:DUF1015 domain-containing protein [Flavobacteriaceae bacterium]